jgi:hypothetical protein
MNVNFNEGHQMKVSNLVGIILLMTILFSCKQQEESAPAQQRHNVQLNFGSYTTASFSLLDLFFPRAHAAVSSLNFCFKRLRFKLNQTDTVNHASHNDNIDISPKRVDINSSGSSIVNVNVPAGNYHRIEFDLERDCDGTTQNSVDLGNGNGSFTSTDRITIKFDGSFTVDGDRGVDLGIQNILDQANNFDGLGGVSLKDAMEAVSGNL